MTTLINILYEVLIPSCVVAVCLGTVLFIFLERERKKRKESENK
jgi:hypothetical protein